MVCSHIASSLSHCLDHYELSLSLSLSFSTLTHTHTHRLSHEFLAGQVSELSTKVKSLEKKAKKAPDDMKTQLKSFLEVCSYYVWLIF